MNTLHFLLPGDLDTPTGGYRYDRAIIQGLRRRGLDVRLHRLDESFPQPDGEALAQATAVLESIPTGATVIVDGLALAPLVDSLDPRHVIVALIHHPLASETGLSDTQRARFHEQERRALSMATQVIVTSPATARELQSDYRVPASRLNVVLPGTPTVDQLSIPGTHGPVEMLCVATITPRKGHALLVEALGALKHHHWTLNCVGSLDRDPDTFAALRQQVDEAGLGQRIRFSGAVEAEALAGFYRRADLFVLPSFHEGYGMVLAEALSFGLPIVSTTAGAIPDTVPADAGLLVPPGDARALSEALALLLQQPSKRLALAAAARQAAIQLPSWDDAISNFAHILAWRKSS